MLSTLARCTIPLWLLVGLGTATAQLSPFDAPAPEEAEDPFAAPFEGVDAPEQPADPFQRAPTTAPVQLPDIVVRPSEGRGVTPERPEGPEPRGLHVRGLALGYQSADQINDLLRHFRSSGFNRLYAEARTPYGLAYAGGTEHTLRAVGEENQSPLRVISERLEGDEKLYAVVSVFPSLPAAAASSPIAGSAVARHPGMVNRRLDGGQVAPDGSVHLDPGHPDTLEYLREVVAEVIREVEPDGVVLTGLQYPGQEWGYSEGAVETFRRIVGGEGMPPMDDPTWSAWRRDRITETVSDLRAVIRETRPGTAVAVLIEAEGNPPTSWDEWLSSRTYSRYMQDWLAWCTDGLVDEVVVAVHERHNPQRSTISNWVHFVNNHSFAATPVISLAGGENFLEGLEIQYKQVRARGAGTVLYSYDRPVRGTLRGFYDGFGRLVFREEWGGPVPGIALRGPREERYFSMMASPPPAATPERAVLPFDEGREERAALVFRSPTPTATPVPEPAQPDAEVLREVTLTNGNSVEVYILEVTAGGYRVQAPGGAAMMLSRGSVREIEPPL